MGLAMKRLIFLAAFLFSFLHASERELLQELALLDIPYSQIVLIDSADQKWVNEFRLRFPQSFLHIFDRDPLFVDTMRKSTDDPKVLYRNWTQISDLDRTPALIILLEQHLLENEIQYLRQLMQCQEGFYLISYSLLERPTLSWNGILNPMICNCPKYGFELSSIKSWYFEESYENPLEMFRVWIRRIPTIKKMPLMQRGKLLREIAEGTVKGLIPLKNTWKVSLSYYKLSETNGEP